MKQIVIQIKSFRITLCKILNASCLLMFRDYCNGYQEPNIFWKEYEIVVNDDCKAIIYKEEKPFDEEVDYGD